LSGKRGDAHHARVNVFITGGSGFIGRGLIPALAGRGHRVAALVRTGSEGRLPAGCRVVVGDPLRGETYAAAAAGADCFVHLVGVSKPRPGKEREFVEIDLKSVQAAVAVARQGKARHFLYLSVAQPAPVMRAYIEVRQRGEALLRESGLAATIVRPWYVLGPGRRWPVLLLPFNWLLRQIPATREAAERLGFVTLEEITACMVHAIEHPAQGVRVIDVPGIRRMAAEAGR